MDRALPGRYIDLIRDGVSGSDLKATGRRAIWSALVSLAMSTQIRGWDQQEWQDLILAPTSRLGLQARSKGPDRSLPAMQVQRQFNQAWERAWELRTERDANWTPAQAKAEAEERAQIIADAIADENVDLTDSERAILAHAVEQTRLRGFTNVALPRRAIYAATGLGSTVVANTLVSLQNKGLLHLHQAGQRAKTPKYQRASIYAFADVQALGAFISDLSIKVQPSPTTTRLAPDKPQSEVSRGAPISPRQSKGPDRALHGSTRPLAAPARCQARARGSTSPRRHPGLRLPTAHGTPLVRAGSQGQPRRTRLRPSEDISK